MNNNGLFVVSLRSQHLRKRASGAPGCAVPPSWLARSRCSMRSRSFSLSWAALAVLGAPSRCSRALPSRHFAPARGPARGCCPRCGPVSLAAFAVVDLDGVPGLVVWAALIVSFSRSGGIQARGNGGSSGGRVLAAAEPRAPRRGACARARRRLLLPHMMMASWVVVSVHATEGEGVRQQPSPPSPAFWDWPREASPSSSSDPAGAQNAGIEPPHRRRGRKPTPSPTRRA